MQGISVIFARVWNMQGIICIIAAVGRCKEQIK